MYSYGQSLIEFYSKLQDEESRLLFLERLQWSFSRDKSHEDRTLEISNRFSAEKTRTISALIAGGVQREKETIIYGAGIIGKKALTYLRCDKV